jgi:hypothetical protein
MTDAEQRFIRNIPPAVMKKPPDRIAADRALFLEFFDEINDLFRRHKEAYGAYRKAVAEVAERTGLRVTAVGHKMAAEHRRRMIAARTKPVEPVDPMNYNLI